MARVTDGQGHRWLGPLMIRVTDGQGHFIAKATDGQG